MVVTAQFIGDPAHPGDIAFFIAPVLFSRLDGNGIPHQMVVDMPGVQMGADDHLKSATQQTVRKFLSNLMGQFRRYLPGGETLHQVEALHPFFLVPHPLDLAHIRKGGIQRTANGRAEQVLLGFILVEGIVHRRLQGVCVLGTGGFFLIQDIIYAIVQAVHGDNAGVRHLPVLLHFLPDRTGDAGHFLHALPAGLAIGVCDLGKLVGVIAKPSHLVKQVGMVNAGPRLQLRPHDEGAQKFLTGKAAEFHLGLQVGQFLFVQMEGNDMVSFSHMDSLCAA